jgi:hypothetical protein
MFHTILRSSHRSVLLVLVLLAFAILADPATAGTGSVPMLIKANTDLTETVVASITSHVVHVSSVWPEIRAMAVVMSPRKVAELQADPYVALVEPDLEAGVTQPDPDPGHRGQPVRTVVPLPTSSTTVLPWNQDMANTTGSAETGAGVTVVVIDSGLPQNWSEFLPEGSVDLEHAVGFGAEGNGDFHSQTNAVRGVGGHIGLFPHGLAVSSVIVGFPSEFGPIGGAAPGARILPIRVLNQFNFSWFSWLTEGVLYAANLKSSGAIPGPMVINFSIQAGGSSQVLTDAINYAISQNVLFVTIAGNFNPFAPISYPGRLPQSITAGAVGWKSEGLPPDPWFFGDVPEGDASQVYVASFSGREPSFVTPGSLIDVVAPGSYVFGEWLFGPGFSEGREVAFDPIDNFIFGTSFAAPHVVGVVARMLEKNPGLTQAQAEAALRGTALPIPASASPFITPLGEYVLPWDAWATGAGLLQGAEAVAATPAPALARAFYRGNEAVRPSSDAAPDVRLLSRAGALPIELGLRGFASGAGTLRIFDVQGRLVRRQPVSGSSEGKTAWHGSRDDGRPAGSGVYFVQVEVGGRRSAAKVFLAR